MQGHRQGELALMFGFNLAGEIEIQGYHEPDNGERFTAKS